MLDKISTELASVSMRRGTHIVSALVLLCAQGSLQIRKLEMAYTEKDYEEVNEIVREISSSLAPNENQESQETKQSSGQKLQEYNGSSKIKLLSP